MSEPLDMGFAQPRAANDLDGDGRHRGDFMPSSAAALLSLVGDGVFDALLDDSVPVYIASATGRLLYANRSYRTLAELNGGELVHSHRRAVERVAERRQPVAAQETLTLGGEARAYAVRHVPIFSGEWLVAVAGSCVDGSAEAAATVRERRERQRFHDVIRSTSDWVWETSETGGLSFVSERIVEVLGIPPRLLNGRKLGDLGRFLSREDGSPSIATTAMQQRRPFRDAPFTIDGQAEPGRLFHLSGVPVFDEFGRFLGYRGTATDVTARHAAEEAARQSRRQLECALQELTDKNLQLDVALRKATAATRAKSEFLATMSHELRTPLNAIIGFSELMQLATFGPLQPAYQGYLNDILNAARHLLELIDDILDIARIEGDALRLDIRRVGLSQLVTEARSMIESRAAEKRIDISAVTYEGPAGIAADQTRALQVLLNLLGNAVKFTQAGGSVGVDVLRQGADVRITVWDTGPGIPADKRELIFEKFQQVHESILARRQEGIGLGLTLSRQLTRLMHGDLLLDPSESGSRFSILLPAAE